MINALTCPSCGGGLDPEARACPQCGVISATRRCGVCFELNLVGAHNCRRCGKLLPEEDPGHRPERIPCPGCGATMTPRKLDNTLFDECDFCGGLWLCPGTLASVRTEAESRARMLPFALKSSGGAEPAGHSASVYRKCPLCSKFMNRTNYARRSGVIVDSCREHGCYFDRGELATLCEFIENGGLEKTRQLEIEEHRASERDARRKAILAGADPTEVGSHRAQDPFSGYSGMDLLRFLGDLL